MGIVFLGHLFKKTVSDSNAPVQEKALDALIAYLRAADADAGRCVCVWFLTILNGGCVFNREFYGGVEKWGFLVFQVWKRGV